MIVYLLVAQDSGALSLKYLQASHPLFFIGDKETIVVLTKLLATVIDLINHAPSSHNILLMVINEPRQSS